MITFIDTAACERKSLDQGEAAEMVSKALCGAEQMTAHLRWLSEGEHFDAKPLSGSHQLLYMLKGAGVVTLWGKDYEIGPGAGLYLGPGEGASLRGAGALKAFHLIGAPA
jgi:mannose-6-phosphate isomerase-like protein (cupin superfamily)